jgi:hypothetical protein
MVRTLLVAGFLALMSPQDWAAADAATRRLAPSVFSSLPAAIRADLERRGCTVPQPSDSAEPVNVSRGHFLGPKSEDWAVLCSRTRFSTILVYRNGQTSPAAELSREADAGYLQTIDGAGAIGFSRAIAPATGDWIRRHHNSADPPLPLLDHEGINDAFIGKGSKVHYFSAGKWLVLSGADRELGTLHSPYSVLW